MKNSITLKDVATYPLPGMAIPSAFAFSPDDTLITYLHSSAGTLHQQLYAYRPESNEHWQWVTPLGAGDQEATLSLEEKLRRERARSRALGITRYAWAKRGATLLLPISGEIYVQAGAAGTLRKLVRKENGPAIDPQFSPDGAWVAYVQDAEVYVVPTAGGEAVQLTSGARGTGRTHGLAEYIAQEEMGRSHGFWWSRDSRYVAFAEVDETHIPIYRIMHPGQDAVGAGAQEDQRYPFAGQVNARVRLGVVPVTGGKPVWLDLEDAEYLARVMWWPNCRLVAQLENREQTELRLVSFDLQTVQGEGSVAAECLLTETSPVWINLHSMLRPLSEGRFIWASERTGFMHLYLYEGNGRLVRQLTEGEWLVDSIAGVDEARGIVYFTATKEHPTERHLYAVSLEGGVVRGITHESGTHQIKLDHGCERFVDVYCELDKAPAVLLRDLSDGAVLSTLFTATDPRIAALGLHPPGLVEFQNRAGVTLYGALYVPSEETFGPGPYPTII